MFAVYWLFMETRLSDQAASTSCKNNKIVSETGGNSRHFFVWGKWHLRTAPLTQRKSIQKLNCLGVTIVMPTSCRNNSKRCPRKEGTRAFCLWGKRDLRTANFPQSNSIQTLDCHGVAVVMSTSCRDNRESVRNIEEFSSFCLKKMTPQNGLFYTAKLHPETRSSWRNFSHVHKLRKQQKRCPRHIKIASFFCRKTIPQKSFFFHNEIPSQIWTVMA